MAISYVGGLTAQITAIASATQSISLTSLGLAAGDFVLVSYTTAAGSDGVLSGKISTSGYSLITELYANGTTNDANMAVFQKIMGGTPDASLVVVGKGTSGFGTTVNVAAFRGVDPTTPLDVTPTTATSVTGSGNANPPAITPATSGNVIAIFGHSATSTTLRTYTTASTAYMSGFLQTNSAGTTYASTSGAGYVSGQSAGVSYDPAAWALSTDNAGNSWCAATLALRPGTSVSVSVTGVAATGEVGTVTVTAVTGVTVPVTGVTATGELGTVSVAAQANVSVTGVTATGTVGTVTVSAKATVSPTGVEATGAVGTVTIDFAIHVLVTGVEATGAVGTVQVSADANTTVSGVQGDSALGDVAVTIGIRADVTGVSATGAVGTAVVVFNTMVFVTGVTAYGRISSVLVWGNVVPAQDANYASVAPNQNPEYSPINPAQTSIWTPIET